LIRFKRPEMEGGWLHVHPELKVLLRDFDTWSSAKGLPDPVVTDLIRTRAEQLAIYVPYWSKLQQALKPGPFHLRIDPEGDGEYRALTASETALASDLAPMTGAQLEARALAKFTWHMARTAADVRTNHYRQTEMKRVRLWFIERCPRPEWELVFHDTAGPHVHVARRDREWRAKYAPVAATV
jgi:hypothetical protein